MCFSYFSPLVFALITLSVVGSRVAGFRERGSADGKRIARDSIEQGTSKHTNLTESSALADTTVLAKFTFDTGGAPDPQGWTTHDVTLQVDTFFHVAGVAELNGGNGGALLPLEGVQSLWCGLAPTGQLPECSYATLPGYGDNWRQRFELQPLFVEGKSPD